MNYKQEQTKAILRHRNSIKAYKILDIQGNNLIVRNSLNREKTIEFSVSDIYGYKVGDYVDMIFIKTGSNSHSIKLIGHTPPEFAPDNEVDIV